MKQFQVWVSITNVKNGILSASGLFLHTFKACHAFFFAYIQNATEYITDYESYSTFSYSVILVTFCSSTKYLFIY